MTKHPKLSRPADSASRLPRAHTLKEIRNTLIDPFATYTREHLHILEGRPSLPGSLWLCYHALKEVEWSVNGRCVYCRLNRKSGHDGDCMVGNALRWVSEFPTEPSTDEVASGVSTAREEEGV